MSDVPDIIRWELAALAKLDVLEDGEVVCEVEEVIEEDAGLGGVLVVTDLQLLFLRTGVVRRETEVISIPLQEIDEARASPSSYGWLGRNRGALTIVRSMVGGSREERTFERIPGGTTRAEEIARTVIRQRKFLEAKEAR